MEDENTNKGKRIRARVDKFMAETAEDMFDEETFKEGEHRIRHVFKDCEIPYTRATLRAFAEGLMISTVAFHEGGIMLSSDLAMTVKKLIKDLELKVESIKTTSESHE